MGQGLGCPALSESAVPRAVGGRQKAHPFYTEKRCSHCSSPSSAATLAFFHGLNSIFCSLSSWQIHGHNADWPPSCSSTGAAPCPHLLLLCARQLPEKLCKNSAFVSEARRRRGRSLERGASGKEPASSSGRGCSLSSALLSGQGSVAGSSLQAPASLHSAGLYRTHFS